MHSRFDEQPGFGRYTISHIDDWRQIDVLSSGVSKMSLFYCRHHTRSISQLVSLFSGLTIFSEYCLLVVWLVVRLVVRLAQVCNLEFDFNCLFFFPLLNFGSVCFDFFSKFFTKWTHYVH